MVGNFIQQTGLNLAKLGAAVLITSMLREGMNDCMGQIGKDINRLKTDIRERRLGEN